MSRARVVAVVQARTGSTRLPAKVLAPVAGAALLQRMLERVRAARQLDDLVVATTADPADEPIRSLCRARGWRCVSGHPTDLIERHLLAAAEAEADVVVKIPSDCPLIDPRIIDRVVGFFRQANGALDFVSNLHPASYPDGCDVEVMTRAALERAGREATRPLEREHTTPYLWDQPGRFRVANVTWETGLDYSMSHRLTIDYPEDLAFVRAVFNELHLRTDGPGGAPPFSLGDILKLLLRRPDIFALNRHLAGVNWYRHHLGELNTITASETVPRSEESPDAG